MIIIICGRLDIEDWTKTSEGREAGRDDEMTAKKVITVSETMTKKKVFLRGKNRATP